VIEVEVKLKIDNPESLRSKLLSNGYKEFKKVLETDLYFNGNDHDFRKSDEALRIRKTQRIDCDVEESKVSLTYKGPKLDKVSMSRTETELGIENFESMALILTSLGYKPVKPVVKTRTYFISDYVVAMLDNVELLGDYLELEVMAEEESDREEALELIKSQLETFGYSMSDTTRTSYLSMIEQIEE